MRTLLLITALSFLPLSSALSREDRPLSRESRPEASLSTTAVNPPHHVRTVPEPQEEAPSEPHTPQSITLPIEIIPNPPPFPSGSILIQSRYDQNIGFFKLLNPFDSRAFIALKLPPRATVTRQSCTIESGLYLIPPKKQCTLQIRFSSSKARQTIQFIGTSTVESDLPSRFPPY